MASAYAATYAPVGAEPGDFWKTRATGDGKYQCTGCTFHLKPFQSKSVKNPGRWFVSCNKEKGGCGVFSFLDEEPKFPQGQKRARTGGNNYTGPIAAAPNVLEERVAQLSTQVQTLESMLTDMREHLTVCCAYIKEATDH